MSVMRRRKKKKKKTSPAATGREKKSSSLFSFFLSFSYLLDKLLQEEPGGDRAAVSAPGVFHVGDLE